MGKENTTEIGERKVCAICFRDYWGFGNNAEPVNKGRCCEPCNIHVVIPARLNKLARFFKARIPKNYKP